MSDYTRFCFDKLPPTPLIQTRAMEAALGENPANRFFGSVRVPMGIAPPAMTTAMALLTGRKWANGRTLKVRFLGGASGLRDRVTAQARKWSEHASVILDFGDHAGAEIRIDFRLGFGSWSALGTDCLVSEWFPAGQATMNYGWLTDASSEETVREVVLHEFGHALGCIHEHQHPEAGIPWNRQAVIAELSGPPNSWDVPTIESNVFERYTASQTQFSRFDPLSIMGYYVPARWTTSGFEMVPGSVLSPTDVDFIGKAYPKGAAVVPLTVGAAPVNASIGLIGEEDHYGFDATSPGTYVVETFGPTDVIASLFGPDDPARLVGEDDDSGEGLNPRITASLATGRYRVMVRHYDRHGTGDYRIRVRRA